MPDTPAMPQPGKKQHINTLDSLRGIAALSVVLFHFSGSSIASIKPNALTDFFSWGKLGVQVFFVISGFIIPYSMYVSGYTLDKGFKFLLKRMTRIVPPASVAILLMFGLYYGALYLKGSPIDGMPWPGAGLRTIFANIFYSYSLLKEGAYISVLWTLEVELQFYILMAFLLPLILRFKNNAVVLTIILFGINLTGFTDSTRIIFFNNNGLFILGLLLFLYRAKIIERNYFIYSLIGIMLITYSQMEAQFTFAGIIALLIIAHVNFDNSITAYLGKISYSLYITHNFAGAVSEIILARITGNEIGEVMKLVMLVIYTAIAIVFASIFYKWVEKPAIALSQKITWSKSQLPSEKK